MKILALRLADVAPSLLLEDEGLENVRNLMSAGTYGRLAHSVRADLLGQISGLVDAKGGTVVRVSRSEDAIRTFQEGGWDYLEVAVAHSELDSTVGRFLDSLDDKAVILILTRDDSQAAFVLTTTAGLALGERDGTFTADLAITVVELAGYRAPASWTGESFANDEPDSTTRQDEEELVRERLRGLGYIA